MHVHLCGADAQTCARLDTSEAALRAVVAQVRDGVCLADLVIACALVPGLGWSAETHVGWRTPADLPRVTGAALPPRFRLIAMRFGLGNAYPFTCQDDYGWLWHFPTFEAHIATIAAHELKHLLQPMLRAEDAVNDAALRHVRRLGFAVEGRQAGRPGRGGAMLLT